jgi:hypothetical protein
MSDSRKAFLFTSIFCFGLGIIGVMAMTIMEFQARQTLPPAMQTPEAIQSLYDGAVCLSCGLNRIVFGILGFGSGILVLLFWGIYETVGGIRKQPSQIS